MRKVCSYCEGKSFIPTQEDCVGGIKDTMMEDDAALLEGLKIWVEFDFSLAVGRPF